MRAAGWVARRRWLLVLCIAASTAEAALILFLGPTASVALAPQVAAPAPIGAFHDLRWLAVYHSSWITFWLELAGLLMVRTTLDTVIVRLAWPAGLARPRWGPLLLRIGSFTAVVVIALAPWVTVLFGLAVTPVSWLMIVALPPVVVVAVLTHHGASRGDWWRRLPPLSSAGWVAATFAVLSLAGGLMRSASPALALLLGAAAGIWDALAWDAVVSRVVTGRPGRRVPLLAPLGTIGMTGLVLGGVAAGFAAHATSGSAAAGGALRELAVGHGAPIAPANPGTRTSRAPPVLIVAGFGTHWDGRAPPPTLGRFRTTWFSYRGVTASGAALPYAAADTQESLATSERKLAVQVESLRVRTGHKVSLVAVSEGSLVAKAYLAADAGAPVSRLLAVSPLPGPGRVYYPPEGSSGWGTASGWALSVLSRWLHAVSPIDITPSTPLFRSIVDRGPELQASVSARLHGVREVAVLPLADAVSSPQDLSFGGPKVVVAAFHNGSLGDRAIRDLLGRLLEGERPSGSSWSLPESILHGASSPWQVPTLAASLNPAWTGSA